jgi:uncharacterized protein (DUF2141 family)
MINAARLLQYLFVEIVLMPNPFTSNQPPTGAGNLTVIVKSIRSNKGQITLSLFHSVEVFPNHSE